MTYLKKKNLEVFGRVFVGRMVVQILLCFQSARASVCTCHCEHALAYTSGHRYSRRLKLETHRSSSENPEKAT